MDYADERDDPEHERAEEVALKAALESAQLADAAMALLGCRSEADVYEVVGDFMALLVPDTVVLVNEATPEMNWLITRKVTGLDESLLSKAAKLVGFEIVGKRSAIVPAYRKEMLDGTLARIPGGLAELASHEMPRMLAEAVVTAFGFSDVFTIGIADGELTLGNLHFLTRSPDVVLPTHIIESFARHCFSALVGVRTSRDLAENAERSRLLLDSMVEGIALHGIILNDRGTPCDYRFLDVNPAFEAMIGIGAEDIVGRTVLEVLPDTEPAWIERYGAVAMTGVAARFEDYSSALGTYYGVVAYSPQPGQFVTVVSDITERKRAEQTTQARLRLLQFAGAHSLGELLQATLDEAEALTGSSIGFYHLLDTDEQTLTLQAWSTNTLEKMCTAQGAGSHSIGEAGVWADCVRERRSVIHNDYAALPHRKGMPEGHTPVVREVVTPVFRGDKIVAILGVGNKLVDYDQNDVKATETLADLAWDIVERKRDERETQQSEAKFATAFNASPDLISITRLSDGMILEVNEGYERLLGYARTESVGKTTDELSIWAPSADRAKFVSCLQETGQVSDFETTLRRKDGALVAVINSAQTFDLEGEACVLSVVHDITERKRVEEELVARNVILSTQQEASADGILVVDAEGRILSYNHRFVEMWHIPEQFVEDGIDEPVLRFVADQLADRQSFLQRVQYLYEHRQETSQDELVLADGRVFDRYSAPMLGPSERYYGRVWYFQDITERRQAEVELERRGTRLEELLEERERNLERLGKALSSIIAVVGQVVETRDPYTAGHERRVSELAVRISEEMGMSAEQIEEIRVAALIHDVGKMSVPVEILSKPGRLTPVEFEIIKCHSEAGHRIIASANMEGPTAEIVYQHHERCDGSGYPRGLSGDELLESAKVIMVADVVEAMSSHRPYRAAVGIEPAMAEIERGMGHQYDAKVSEACKRVIDAGFTFSDS